DGWATKLHDREVPHPTRRTRDARLMAGACMEAWARTVRHDDDARRAGTQAWLAQETPARLVAAGEPTTRGAEKSRPAQRPGQGKSLDRLLTELDLATLIAGHDDAFLDLG